MTIELIVVGVAAALMLAALWWVSAEPVTYLAVFAGAVLVGAGVEVGFVDDWGAYAYGGITLGYVVWALTLGGEEGDEETVFERLIGLTWRTPMYWLAGIVGGFCAAVVGALAVYLVGIAVLGWVDWATWDGPGDCNAGDLAIRGCEGLGGKEIKGEDFLNGSGFDVLMLVFAIVVAVASLLAAFGLPNLFNRHDEDSSEGGIGIVGMAGVGLWVLAVVGTVVAITVSWAQRGEFIVGKTTLSELDPTPEREDGSVSHEFEKEDIERAEAASQRVVDYCSGADSEAQFIGCLSHVDESDIP